MQFVKTQQFNEWSLVFDGSEPLQIDFNSRMERDLSLDFLHGKSDVSKLQHFHSLVGGLDYSKYAEKYGTIYIHENGSWHNERNPVILEIVECDTFPTAKMVYDTVVCENDKYAVPELLEELMKRGCNVKVINYFDSYSLEQIKLIFSQAKSITFFTTFTTFDWFEKLLEAATEQHTIFGICENPQKQFHAKSIANSKGFSVDFI